MKYIADLHIHSPFSRATSKTGTLEGLFAWARVKGIHVVGTGDFTHPGWFSQLKKLLEPAEYGFFRLKNQTVPLALPGIHPEDIPSRFVLSAEISSIYKRHGKVRKVHNLLYVPDFSSAERINSTLAGIGNIEADGRPILGLDSRDLLEILLEKAPEGFLVPAHIWTPWFSLFGSKSGFDAIEECYGDLSEHVFALETGLSSDPDMNRRISALDRFALISNSDCHSPAKLGREANIFHTDFNYTGLSNALRTPLAGGLAATIEFYPEEGKYHCDGHRKCQVCLEPAETRKLNETCPVCGAPLTIGVLHRVLALADRNQPHYPPGSPSVHSLIPLPEILGEILGVGPGSKSVMELYARVIGRFGSEFNLFLATPIAEISRLSPVLAEAVQRVRDNRVIRQPGYDGEFGVIRVFAPDELAGLAGQISLFSGKSPGRKKNPASAPLPLPAAKTPLPRQEKTAPMEINPEQQSAIACEAEKILVAAGPGTGKTFTLVARISHLVTELGADPGKMVAISFTNRAAGELRQRLLQKLGDGAGSLQADTFHGFCLDWLRRDSPDLTVLGDEARELYVRKTFPRLSMDEQHLLGRELAVYHEALNRGTADADQALSKPARDYLASLGKNDVMDLDLVVPHFLALLRDNIDFRARVLERLDFLFVDEFQDLNHPQYELVLLLAEKARLFVIGDANQAIYGFRGSSLDYFRAFSQLPGVVTLALIRNYRSAPAIVHGATAVIRRNRHSGDTELLAESASPAVIELHTAGSARDEAEFVARRIEEILGGTSSFSLHSGRAGNTSSTRSFADIAILVRLRPVAETIAEALAQRGIPFQLVGATPFYMLPGLRIISRHLQAGDDESTLADFLLLLKDIPGIGADTLTLLEEALPVRSPDFFSAAAGCSLPARVAKIIRTTHESIRDFRQATPQEGIATPLTRLMARLRIDPAEEHAARFLALAGVFGADLKAFLAHLRQNARTSVYDDRAEAVAIMTMHAAKGLEFPVVFLAGLEEEIIPCTIARLHSDEEEERRIFYVAMTRSRETLILSCAAGRTIFHQSAIRPVSRFVREIPGALIARTSSRGKKQKKTGHAQTTLF
jgi:uncharacterized protein (TIGR00375 family)